jgi:ubiquinone/menaquinone biosynthesis C-methylase UbiE
MESARLAALFDRAAPLYDTVEPRFFRDIARRLVARLSVEPGTRVLDVATGPGVVLSEIAAAGVSQAELIGVDLSAGMIREARARLATSGASAHLVVMDARQLGLLDGSFDRVTMSRAYLLPSREAILRELRRVLRPGGIVAIAEFGRLDQRWSWVNDLYARLLPQAPSTGRRIFDMRTFQQELEGAGFDGVRVETEDLDVSFASLEAWWESAMSHGERGALELMDDDARRAFFELADPSQCVEADGRMHWRPEVLFGFGVRHG